MTTRKKIIITILAAGGLAILLYVAFLAGAAVSTLDRNETEMKATISSLLALSQGILTYEINHGEWPSSLAALDKGPPGPYIKWGSRIPGADIWNNPIQYERPSSSSGLVVLRSLGKDGKAGGIWSAADIEIKFNHEFFQRSWSNYWSSCTIKESTR